MSIAEVQHSSFPISNFQSCLIICNFRASSFYIDRVTRRDGDLINKAYCRAKLCLPS